jgi:hypothetical protein
MASFNNSDFIVKNGIQIKGYINSVGNAIPTDGQLLIGDSTNNRYSIGSLTVSNGLLYTPASGAISISTNATNNNTVSTIVARDASGNFSAGSITASLIGNASTATVLKTARTISGVSFDGSANITLTTSGVTEGSNLYYTSARASLAAPVQSVFSRTGNVVLTSSDITTAGGALTASPTFTGTPAVPTATAGTNTTQIASTAFVSAAISASNAGVASFNTRTGAITLTSSDITAASGALLASPTFTGIPTAPTAAFGDNSTAIATTAFVQSNGLTFNSFIAYNTNTPLTASLCGKAIQWFGPTNGQLTLPTNSTVAAGKTFYIFNQGAGNLIINLTTVGDFIWTGTSNTAITLIKGESAFLLSRATGEYDLIGGTSASKYAPRQLVNTTTDDGATALQVSGFITATTPLPSANNTQVATTAFVNTAVSAIAGGLNYQGTWNASTNTPTLVSSTGTKGYFYKVTTAGSTSLDGLTQWNVGDMAAFNGTVWDKIDGIASEVVSVAGRTGIVTLANTDISGLGTMSTQNANAVAITGGSINATTIGATTASTGIFTTMSTGNAIISGGSLNAIPIGATTKSTGAFTNLTSQSLTVSGQTVKSYAAIAAAGTTQATATVAATDVINITSGTGGVMLPTNVNGGTCIVINNSSAAVNLYPTTGNAIDFAAVNTAMSLPAQSKMAFVSAGAAWYSIIATYA